MMVTEPYRIRVKPDSELARLLDEIGDAPALLEKNGKLYRLTVEPVQDLWAGYSPQKARSALSKSAGALRGIDREELLADIHLARKQNSRGRPA
ncbi:MAG: hypothetical protein KatS3mg050_4039 [Litorilinea sp.]|nr:MAG: hypothetical protein KatS3mg050_4039 [Litorilinea sp.]